MRHVCITVSLFFLSYIIRAQNYRVDTLHGMAAYTSNYMPLPVYGLTNNGHIYTCGLNNHFTPAGKPLPLEMIRIDLTTGSISYKTIAGTLSSSSAIWQHVFDSSGNFYLGLNSNNRKIYRFNLKDSITYENLGNGFPNGNALAYSLALGQDNHIYFGGSSGRSYWSEYDPVSRKLSQHPPVDSLDDYVLSIQGDKDYVYCQTGQRTAIHFWAIRKADNKRKLLFAIPNTKRFGVITARDGYCYVSLATDTLTGMFKLQNGMPIPVKYATAPASIEYTEVNGKNQPVVKTYFDAGAAQLYYSVNNTAYKIVALKTSLVRTDIRLVFGFKNDPDHIYYAGDYYGNYYRYDVKTNTSTPLGNTGYNIYAALEQNDSIMWMSGYPSGYIMKWNRNQPWTTQQFTNGQARDAYKDPAANPKLVHYFKSNTAAGFHHAAMMTFDVYGNVVAAGNVIRIANTASIGVYNPSKDTIYGYDYNKIDRLGAAGIARWRDLVIFSTNRAYGGTPKLYIYNSRLNSMTDSMNLGFNDYGKIYVKGDTLTGICKNRVYRVNLTGKKLLSNQVLGENTIAGSFLLSNGKIVVNTREHLSAFPGCVSLPYNVVYENNGMLYTLSGKYVFRITGY